MDTSEKGTPEAVKWIASTIGVLAIFCLCLHYVLTFGVNVPYWDEWELLSRFREIYSGRMHWWELAFSKHNEHLIGFAFLVNTLQLLITGFNSKAQLVSGVLFQTVAFGISTATLWRVLPENKRPLWLVLASLIWFSLMQYKNWLWAFQTAWFIVSLLLAITLASLQYACSKENSAHANHWFAAAVLAALLASFTSSQGVLLWPTAAVYLLGLSSFKFSNFFAEKFARRWMGAALFTGAVFVIVWIKKGGGGAGGGGDFSFKAFVYIFVGIHGAFFGDTGVWRVAALGAVMLLLVLLALVKAFASENKASYAMPVALITFGLMFTLLVAIGRAKFGTGAARDSHYTAYLVMTFFGALTIFMRPDKAVSARGLIGISAALYGPIVAIAFFSSSYIAILQGIEWQRSQGIAAAALLNYREEPDIILANLLFGDAKIVRRNAEFLESNNLGIFGDRTAIPDSVSKYIEMPMSMRKLAAQFPNQKEAISQTWWVYQIGNDLQHAFEPTSEDFAKNLIQWCYGASKQGDHYLSHYLTPYKSDYELLIKAVE